MRDFYGADQAGIHHARFGDLAADAAGLVVDRLRASDLRHGHVTDLGCGSGILAAARLDAGYSVAGIASPTTMANLVTNATVEVNVVDPVRRKGYRLKGRARAYTDGPMFEQALRYFEGERGIEVGRIRGVAIIAIERAAALISPAYSRDATEQEVSERFVLRLEEIHGWKIDRPGAAG